MPAIHLVPLPPPPAHLSEQMRRWWREVVEGFELDAYHRKILEAACDSWDQPVSNDVRCAVSRGGAYPATVFYKLSGQILTLCEADGTVAIDAVRGTLHGNS